MSFPAERRPAPSEWHTYDDAAGRCDRPDCAERYDRCPAAGLSVPYDAGAWPKRAATAPRADLPVKRPLPPAPALLAAPLVEPAPPPLDAFALSPPVSERARQKIARQRPRRR